MNNIFLIKNHEVHLWQVLLTDFIKKEQALLNLLSPDEVNRALRFHSAIHKQRYIITRGLLRKTLSLYTDMAPAEIAFSYNLQGKPFLQNNPFAVQFNVAHSAEIAVYAMTLHKKIGIDIEKIKLNFNERVAKRFFSLPEYEILMALKGEAQVKAFYRIWSSKEAVIKAVGAGIFVPLPDFTIFPQHLTQSIAFHYQQQDYQLHVENFLVAAEYAAAFATPAPVGNIIRWHWSPNSLNAR
jgi:4'-phosphopantetheinyl transferase